MSSSRPRRRIPEASVARLPIYLQILIEQADTGVHNISSEGLAELAGVNAAKVRKDLSYLGSYGVRGVGYEVDYLIFQIRREMGLDHDWPVVIVGGGNLGQALAGYGGFSGRGFPVGAIVDNDPAKVDTVVGGVRIHHIDELDALVSALEISIGAIATPASAAQEVADRLVATPGNKTYGILSVQVQLAATVEYLFTVPRTAFHPQPKVDSAIIRLTFNKPVPDVDGEHLRKVIRQAFSQKRKMLRNTLSPLMMGKPLDGWDLTRRAETLSLDEFVQLAKELVA
jgi:redox-sensing transcriptional repressor